MIAFTFNNALIMCSEEDDAEELNTFSFTYVSHYMIANLESRNVIAQTV